MKYVIILALALAGCTSSNDDSRQLKADLKEAQLNLGSCQSRLEMYTSSNQSTEVQAEPAAPAEPQCEEQEWTVLSQNGHKLDTCLTTSTEACGIAASDCQSGQAYACLRDVSYKTITLKKCE